jgi:hypothetical protein
VKIAPPGQLNRWAYQNLKSPGKLKLACMVVVFCAAPVGAQSGNSDRCEVISVDVTGRKLSQWDKLQGRRLGTFDTTIAEEELTTKIYRLPKTKLFVVASVWYTDESMASKRGADSISLQLFVSTKAKRDLRNTLVYSDAEMPLNGFDVARVTAMAKSGHRMFMLLMECKEHIRR